MVLIPFLFILLLLWPILYLIAEVVYDYRYRDVKREIYITRGGEYLAVEAFYLNGPRSVRYVDTKVFPELGGNVIRLVTRKELKTRKEMKRFDSKGVGDFRSDGTDPLPVLMWHRSYDGGGSGFVRGSRNGGGDCNNDHDNGSDSFSDSGSCGDD